MKKILYVSSVLFIFVLIPSVSLSECIEGNCQNGKGTFVYSDDLRYEGEWKNGKKHGQGTLISYGNKYEGGWENGLRHGAGKLTNYKGEVIRAGYWEKGWFKNDKPSD